MVNKNIQMKKREGNDWDNLYPITLTENVFNENGVDLNDQMQEIKDETDVKLSLVEQEVNKTVKVVKVEHFGAVADGVTDDKEAIQNAIDSLDSETGGEVHLMNGTHYISDSVIVDKNNVTIVGGHNTWLTAKENHTIKGLIRVEGTIKNEIVLGVDLIRGQTQSPVSISTDYAIIKTLEKYNDERAYYRKGEIARTEQNIFTTGLSGNYTASGNNLTIQEIEPVRNFKLTNVNLTKTLDKTESNDSQGITLNFVVDSIVEKVFGEHFDGSHIFIDRCYNVEVNNTKFEDGNEVSGLCYGIQVANSSRDIHINDIEGKRLRHLVAFGGNGLGLARFCTVNRANDSLTYSSSFDVHNIAENITYNHCVGENGQFGGTRTTFNHCYFNSPKQLVGDFIFRLPSAHDLKLNNCTFDGITGFTNRSDYDQNFNIEINACTFIVDDRDFETVRKFDNFTVNMKDTTFLSNVKPILSETGSITNKTKFEMRFGKNSVYQNVTFKNLIDVIQLYHSDTTMVNCQFIETFGYEITVNSTLGNIKNIKINNNLINTKVNAYSGANRTMIRVNGSNEIKNMSIVGNSLSTNQRNKKAIVLNDLIESVVNSNTVYSTGWGIELGSGTLNNVVANNVITSDGNSISDSGTNIVANNYKRFP